MDKDSLLVLFIGDSLISSHYKDVRLEKTYLYLLEMFWRELDPKTYTQAVSKPGSLLIQIFGSVTDWFTLNTGLRKVDICIVHCGIIDCSPRVLTHGMRTVVSSLPTSLRNLVIKLLHRSRRSLLKSGWSYRYTPPKKFKRIYTDLVKFLSSRVSRLYLIDIAPGKDFLYLHSPGLKSSILEYNKLIGSLKTEFPEVHLIQTFEHFQEYPEKYLTEDLHITEEGQFYIYSQIRELEIPYLR